jgi:hypothetical protein
MRCQAVAIAMAQRVDAEPELPGAAGDARGHVQHTVAERGDLAAGDVG